MPNPQITAYIKNELAAGQTIDAIREALLTSGWDKQSVDDSISSTQPELPLISSQPVIASSPNYTTFLGPIELFKKAIQTFSENSTTYLVLTLPLVVIAAITVFLIPDKTVMEGSTASSVANNASLGLGFVSMTVINIIVSILSTVSLYYALANRVHKPTPVQAVSGGLNHLIPYVVVSLLTLFVTTGGLIALVIPGIIIALMIQFAPLIAVTENIGGLEALVRSRAYTRGSLVAIFLRLLFLLIPLILAGIAFSLFGKYSNIFSPLLTTIFSIYSYLMYENLRALRPNIDSKQGGRTRTLFLVLACITPLLIPVGGVLGAVTLLAINPASLLRTSRDTTRMANIASLNVGIETYVVEQNSLPTSLDQLTKYIQVIPADPKTQQSYYYSITPDGKHYKVCATMEQPNKFKDNQFCATDEGVDPIPRATKQN